MPLVDADLEKAENINFERINDLYELKNDIDDGLALIYSLKNIIKRRKGFSSLSKISKLVDGMHYFDEEIHKDLNR